MSQRVIGQILLNQYRVDEFIGSGSMSVVYRVWDLKRNTPLAMKILKNELADDPSVFKYFRRGAKALEKLAHPHIVPFYGLERTDDFAFALEGYIKGPSVKDILRQNGKQPLPILDALCIMRAVCSALGYAHANGVIHCDVKPGNIMVDSGGNIFLTDFGIARHADSTTTTMGAAGTPAYMAPEQIRGEVVTAATDVYAMGMMVYEMLTGRRPFEGKGLKTSSSQSGGTQADLIRAAHLNQPPPDPSTLYTNISPQMAAIMLKALNKNPQERFQDIMAFYSAIRSAAGFSPDQIPERLLKYVREPEIDPVPGISPVAPVTSRSPRKMTLPLILGGAGLLLVSIVFLALNNGPKSQSTLASIPPDSNVMIAARTEDTSEVTLKPTNTTMPMAVTTNQLTNIIKSTITPIKSSAIHQTNASVTSNAQGNWVVYAYNEKQYERDLYLLNIETGQEQKLTSDEGGNIAPTFSPEGSQIAFVACPDTSNTCSLNLMDLKTRRITPVSVSTIPDIRFPDWCQLPESPWLAFEARSKNPNKNNIWRINLENGTLEQVTDGDTDIRPSWSPDCNQIVFERFDPKSKISDIYIHNLLTGTEKRVISTPDEDEFGVTWSHDGQWIAYSRTSRDTNRDGFVNLDDQADLFIIRPDGSGEVNLTRGKYSVFSPTWSPDSQRILFTAYYGNNRSEMMIYDLSNGQFNELGKGIGPYYHTQWSP